MAASVVRNFGVTSGDAPIIVRFSPSADSSQCSQCEIDSRHPQGLGGIMGATYWIKVQLSVHDQALVFHEEVSGSNPDNGVEGTFTIPISKFEEPNFHNTVYRGKPCIEISFAVRRGQALTMKHFEYCTLGTWENGTASTLQMWMVDEWASETRVIKIILLAPHNIYNIKAEIQRALNLPVTSARPPRPPTATSTPASSHGIFTTAQQVPRAGVARIPPPTTTVTQTAGTNEHTMFQGNEDARRKNEAEAALISSLGTIPLPPSKGTSITPFMSVKLRMLDIYVSRDDAPEVGLFIDDLAPLKGGTASKAEPLKAPQDSEIFSRITKENDGLRAKVKSLQFKQKAEAAALSAESSKSVEESKKRDEQIRGLQKQLEAALAPTKGSGEDASSNLLDLDLDLDENVEADDTRASTQGSWLEKYFPNTDTTPNLAEALGLNTTTTASTQPTDTSPNPSTPSSANPLPVDPDMRLRIEDAVNTVGAVMIKALKEGKGVIVQITEPKEIPEWLERVHQRIMIDSMGLVRAAP